MSKSVSNVGDQIHIFTLLTSKKSVNSVYYYLYDINILPLVEATNVVGFSNSTLMEYKVYGTSMVLNKEPVTNILTLTINRQRLAIADIVDEQRNQLLWELIRTIVVRAVRNNRRHSVCIMESTNEVVTACL